MRDEVLPALADLRDGLSRHRFMLEVARSMVADARIIVEGAIGTTVGLGIASVTDVATWIAAGLPSAGAVGASLVRAGVSWADGPGEVARQHDLYYLYALDRSGSRRRAGCDSRGGAETGVAHAQGDPGRTLIRAGPPEDAKTYISWQVAVGASNAAARRARRRTECPLRPWPNFWQRQLRPGPLLRSDEGYGGATFVA